MEPKALTLNEVARMESDDLFVMNRTSPSGNLFVDVMQGNEKTVVNVPATFIPVNMTMFATKQSLLQSPQFRRMVSIGMLRVISDSDAQQLLRSSEAKREWQNLFANEAVGDNPGTNANAEAYNLAKAESDQSINPFVLSIVGMSDVEEDQLMSMLRGRERDLSAHDWSYLANKSTVQSIKSYAAEKLVEAERA